MASRICSLLRRAIIGPRAVTGVLLGFVLIGYCAGPAMAQDGPPVVNRAAAGLTGVDNSSSSVADVDNDGHLDVLITGNTDHPTTTLYLGDGQGGFTPAEAGLTDVRDGSTAIGDVNNDGHPDLLISGNEVMDDLNPVPSTTLYLGNGTGGFTVAGADLTGLLASSSSMGDVNNDGHLDLLITGDTGEEEDNPGTGGQVVASESILYLGDGTGSFTVADAGLTDVYDSSTSFGDVNNDGNLDVLLTGDAGEDGFGNEVYETTLYFGDGTGGFTESEMFFTGVRESSTAIADANNDGILDLFVTGYKGSDYIGDPYREAVLYLGDGEGGFAEAGADITGISEGSASMGDVNDDGNVDLLLTGQGDDATTFATLYLGDGTGGFTDADAALTGVVNGSSTLGDIDGDSDLDLVISGFDTRFGPSARVYANRTVQEAPNRNPRVARVPDAFGLAPGRTTSRLIEGGDPDGDPVSLSLASSSPTNGASLTDNGDGFATFSLTPPRDLAGESISFTVEIADGNGGSTTESFSVHVGSFALLDAGLFRNSALSMGDVNGDGNLDLMSGSLYFGDGQGGFTNSDAAPFSPSDGSSDFADVNNDGNLDILTTGDVNFDPSATLYLGDGQGNFTEAGAGLTPVENSSASMGDVNNDGTLDVLITGEDEDFDATTTLYLGDGDGGFTAAPTDLPDVEQGASSMADVDDDGNLDILLTGDTNGASFGGYLTTLYLGDGSGGFTAADAGLADVTSGSTAIADLNDDGALDLLITGLGPDEDNDGDADGSARLYWGDGTGGFTNAGADLPGFYDSSTTIGDVNNDGAPDLLIAGLKTTSDDDTTPATLLYLGNGTGGFDATDAGLLGLEDASITLGDVDNDGHPDLLVSGDDAEGESETTLYENTASGSLLAETSTQTVSSNGTVEFGDTGAAITFSGTSGSGDVIVQRYTNAPINPQGISGMNVSQYRFVISAGGDLSFDAATEVRLDVGTLGGINDPTNVMLYTRDTPGSGSFTALTPTEVDDNGTPNDLSDDVIYASTDSFSEFVLASDTEPLPVELARFDAQSNEDAVALTWTTASETNNARFDIQRKHDASGWQTIGSVAGAGTTSQPQSYRFTDETLPYAADAVTYRLRQVDTDGTAHASDAVTVQRSVDGVRLLSTHPNPAQQRLTVRYAVPERQKVTVRLYDVLGRRVDTVVRGTQAGRHEQHVDVSGLASGVYVLRLQSGGTVRTQKVTVVR